MEYVKTSIGVYGQLDVRRKFNETYYLPVFHYAELLALSFGFKPEEPGLNTLRVSTDSAIKKIAQIDGELSLIRTKRHFLFEPFNKANTRN